jgi:glycosyltransferase involved in cell wall biosynthesis
MEMARIGMNPLRNKKVYDQAKIVVTAITHLPDMEGYHKHRLDVIKLSLMSMKKHAPDGVDFAIWDNGSCVELTDWLRKAYQPTQLILSKNVGKWSARTALLRMFHPKTIVSISDDDMFYYPDWLEKSLDLLEHFPNVGQVSCYPVRTQFRWGSKYTIAWARAQAKVDIGMFIPEQWERDFAVSIGRPWKLHQETSAYDLDYRVKYNERRAYLTAHHCQFICECGRLQPFLVWSDIAMPDEKPFDNAIDSAGLLRLTTIERLSRHIGNFIDGDIAGEAVEYGLL